MSNSAHSDPITVVSSRLFVAACAATALAVAFSSAYFVLPVWLIAAELFSTVVALFLFSSTRVRIDKNAVSYGSLLITATTFGAVWWPNVGDISEVAKRAMPYLLSLHGWDELVHADTMLFILGLTFFVAAIAETRLLERVGFALLRRSGGRVVPTVIALAALVSFASGILDGVSMIGLMIRVLIVMLVLAKAEEPTLIYAVLVSTITTTVCGMWLAYGEPPNLIMKSNLHPYLNDVFFLKYCLPIALGSYGIVVWNVRRALAGLRVDVGAIALKAADVETSALRRAQSVAVIAFVPFVGLLVWHAIDHSVPLFWSSFAGAAGAFVAIRNLPGAMGQAYREGKHEYIEYLFLLPLFLSVTFLQKSGFFEDIARALHSGTDAMGAGPMAFVQFMGATVLSAGLDNNVVADFAGRAIGGFDRTVLHLFAMAQIAGYAVGGCWTHIGSAQSVVAYAFAQKKISPTFTPLRWIKAITPVLLEIFVLALVWIGAVIWLGL